MKKLFLLFVLSAAMILGSAFAYSKRGGDHERILELAKELDLTVAQREKLKSIKSKYHEQISPQREKAREAKQDLVTALQAPKKDEAYNKVLRDKFSNIQELKREIHKARFEMSLEIRGILTDNQIGKFKDWHHDGPTGHKGLRGHKGHGDSDKAHKETQ